MLILLLCWCHNTIEFLYAAFLIANFVSAFHRIHRMAERCQTKKIIHTRCEVFFPAKQEHNKVFNSIRLKWREKRFFIKSLLTWIERTNLKHGLCLENINFYVQSKTFVENPATEKHDKNVEKELGNRRRVMLLLLLLRSVDDEREKSFHHEIKSFASFKRREREEIKECCGVKQRKEKLLIIKSN